MSDRLAEVSAHLRAVRQVGAVVNAMRGMAGSRAQQARALLPAVRAYAEVATRAIGQAVALQPQERPPDARRATGLAPPSLIVFGAEQGFVGGFADRVLDAAGAVGEAAWLMVGARTAMLARERGRALAWQTGLPAHAAALPATALAIAEALFGAIAGAGAGRIEMVVPVWGGSEGVRIERRRLLPLDPAAFALERDGPPPLTTLAPAVLLTQLTEEYVFARICEAAVEAYVAENQARVSAMAGARSKIEAQLVELQQLEHRVRQEAITAEVVELSARAASAHRMF
jgi:F-type H+-transporting ATPase subunit gamma